MADETPNRKALRRQSTQSSAIDPASLPKTWFEAGTALEVISVCFQAGALEIRIASGFFTVKGWGLIRRFTTGKHVYLLVGLDDPGEDRARAVLVNEIMRALRTGLDRDRRQSVIDLVARMESGQFQILDARAINHHAKIYLVDCTIAIVASANTTGRGLIEQIEAGSLIIDPQEVSARVDDFDRYFSQAKDLTQELLEALQQWLRLVSPWDIYLKTMLALEDLQPIKATYKKQPLSYQVDMIAQTLRQIRDCGGSMLVASTGLGKTVVAIHVALHLRQEGEIDNVVVIGPKAVQRNWERELFSAGLAHKYFVLPILDMKSAAQAHDLEVFEEIVENIHDQRTLLIIDESHELRNRYPGALGNQGSRRTERRAFQRLTPLIQSGNVKVLLLSGSPYAKDIDNINNQLYLLPHTSENRSLLQEPQYADRAWQILESNEFINLPVASQLTTPHVAKYYGQQDSDGIYINYGQEKRYVPNIRLHNIEFPLDGEDDLAPAIAEKYLQLKARNPMFKYNIERLVKIAWASSRLATRTILERVLDTPNGPNAFKFSQQERSEFIYPLEARQAKLAPIVQRLKNETYENDIKLITLQIVLTEHHQRQEKVIIFCERRATVIYLERGLRRLMPSLRVAITINEEKSDSFGMKETREVETLIKQFAPIANNAEGQHIEDFDVFISTDAHGVGVNMQDASVVINYDIDWTPIGPIQRAGRILRFWQTARTVHIYTFVPKLTATSNLQRELMSIGQRWEKLMTRHEESRKLTDLPVLTISRTEDISVPDMASQVTIRSGQLDLEALADMDISPYYQHTAKLQMNREYANSLLSDLISAKTYPRKSPAVYVLVQHNEKYYGLVYYPETQQYQTPKPVQLLDLIACEPDTPIAAVDINYVDAIAEECIQVWCQRENVNPDAVSRECILYLKPDHENDEMNQLLNF